MQSRKGSLIEAIVNTFIGFIITCLVAPLLYWLADVHMTPAKMGLMNLLFTIVSVIRNYFIRRWFNGGKIYTYGNNKRKASIHT